MQSVDGDIKLSVAFDQKTITQSANELKKTIENSLKGTSGGGAEKAIESVQNAAENAQKALSEMGNTKTSDSIANATAESAQKIGNAFKSLKIPVDTTASTMKTLEGNVAAAESKAALLAQKLDELKNAKTPTKEYANLEKEIEKAASAADEAEKKFQDAKAAFEQSKTPRNFISMEGAKEEAEKAGAALDELIQKQAELENEGKAFKPVDEAAVQRTAAALQAAQTEADIARTRVDEFRTAVETQANQEAARSATEALREEETEIERVHASLNRMSDADLRAFAAEEQRAGAQREASQTSRTAAAQLEQVGSAVKRVISPLGRFAKFVGTSTKKLLQHASASKKAKSSTFNFEGALKKGIRTILKYGLGIRSTYVLFNKLRSAVKEGYKNLAGFSPEVNASISGILSSLAQLKNQLAAAFEPIVTVVAPYIKQLIDWASQGALAIAKFLGALTGRQTVYKAAEQNKQYVESLTDTADAANKAQKAVEKYLSPLDDLNIYKDPTADALTDVASNAKDKDAVDYSNMFTIEPIEEEFFGFIERAKSRISTLFEPIKSAWDTTSPGLITSIEQTVSEIIGLFKDLGRDFSTVWANGSGERIMTNIFNIIKNISTIVGNLIKRFRKAWNENGRGVTIVQGIADIFESITHWIDEITESWAEWADTVDFAPLLDSVIEFLPKIEGLIDTVGKAFQWVSENVLQPLASWFIESIIPVIIEHISTKIGILQSAFEILGGIVEFFFNAIGAVWTGLFGDTSPLDLITDVFSLITQQFKWLDEKLGGVSEALDEFFNLIDWDAVAQTWKDFFDGIKRKINAFGESIIGAFKWITEDVPELFSSMCDTVKELWDELWDGFISLLDDLGILEPIQEIVDGITEKFDGIISFVTDVFSVDWEKAWEDIKDIFKGVWDALEGIVKVTINLIIDIINGLMSAVATGINAVVDAINTLSFEIPDWVPEVGGETVGFDLDHVTAPEIPKLATGAVIPANREFLAIMGDQTNGRNLEAPEDLIRQIVREESGRGNSVQHIHLHVGSREIAEAVVEGGRVIMGQTGANPFVMA